MADREIILASVSAYLAAELQEWRNESPDSMTHKVVGGLGFAGVAILGVIETVVRGILSLIALPFIYCLPESQDETRKMLAAAFPMGSLLSAGIVMGCFVAIFGSCCTDEAILVSAYVPKCVENMLRGAGDHFDHIIEPTPVHGRHRRPNP